jgi:excisionase family DNA binding protein
VLHCPSIDKEALLAWPHQRLTFGDAMKRLGVGKATLHRWVEQGELTPLEDMGGKQRWFARHDVEALVEGRG